MTEDATRPEAGTSRLAAWTGLLIRLGILAGALLVLVYPVRAFLNLAVVPLAARLCWPVAFVVALNAPLLSLYLFAALSPLLPIVPVLAGWGGVSLAEMWFLALLAAAWVRVAAGRRPWRGSLPPWQPILLLLASASLVVRMYPYHLSHDDLWSFARSLDDFLAVDFIVAISQRYLYASIVSWAVVAEGLALVWLILSEPSPEPRRKAVNLLSSAAAGGVLVAAYGLFQWWTRRHLLPFWVDQDPAIVRINATMSDVNALGSYLALMIWLALAMAGRVSRVAWRWGWRAAAVAVAVALLFTASRVAWLAAVAGVFLYACGALRFGLFTAGPWRRILPRVLAGTAAAVLIAVGSLTAYATIRDIRHAQQRTYLHTALYTLNLKTPLADRLKGRLAMWDAAVRMVADRPVFGIGIGRYYKDVARYAPRQEALIRPQENAHNYFLQIAAELGLSGALCFVALIVTGVVASVRAASDTSPPAVRRFALAAGVGIVVYAITCLTGHPLLLREGQFAFWPVVSAALVLARGAAPVGSRDGARRGWRVPRGLSVAAAAALIVVSVPERASREAQSVDQAGQMFGVFDTEIAADGTAYRWTGGAATIIVRSTASALVLPLRSLAPFAQTVTLLFDGRMVDSITLDDNNWHVLRYLTPRRRNAPRFLRVELRVTPTFQPAGEARTLGVMLGQIVW